MPPKKQITITIPDHLCQQVERFSSSQQELFKRALDKSIKDFLSGLKDNDNDKEKENYSSSNSKAIEDFLKQGETLDEEFQEMKSKLGSLPDIEFSDDNNEQSEKEKLKSILSRYSSASDEELEAIVNKASASLPTPQREKFSSSASSASSSASEPSGAGYWDHVIEQNNKIYRERKEKDIHRGL
jgi:ATP-dependent protease HslVU (ClpYQ) ATPase subunit